ncbi:bis(5'-nucleosyl)-tetraphosphatase (symmetrical) YqeK [Oxynema aestuarii]|jgi:predicted HD superfamily hydrolase involved in NAD metabolism|uniref:bis(5'-nucleosyl)-tetraphosphatase (symmetrical) n=1 Tax=Oxynema aestuarii AP17 TaxID=2064643 RepID=A0A6H1TX91_9CYAN|nr:bis(5'-nucleosyl)-tetraphosphatase (symmetrical) YqeK [Oxynema aestuarii]QIZ71035.1 HD domain-containing protein [Oxynema aestuarii AP17]RMH71707.1 MAG: HD domain-containing protein [Cyanobacteria bacterium J007]
MRDRILAWLEERVPAGRIRHILRVEQMAGELALLHGIDENRAKLAGLLHDLAKYFKPKKLLEMATREGLEIDGVLEANPHLLHADVSAIVAREEFGVKDEEMLAAIADHTLGRPQMSALSCVVFLADSLEPGRGNTPELAELRQACRDDLYKAVWLTGDYTQRYLIDRQQLIHPRTILTRNWAMQAAKSAKSARKQGSGDRVPA